MRHLYVQGHNKAPTRSKILLLICTGLILLIGAWLLLDYGKWRMIYQEMAGAIMQKSLVDHGPSEKEQKLMLERDELQKQVTVLERTIQIDKIAQDEVRNIISELEATNLELREELGFFENILVSMDGSRGLKVQSFRLEPLIDKQRYRFELVLTRIVKGGRVTKGDVSITLQGNSNAAKVDYDLKDLLADEDSRLRYEIKHFKLLEGVFSIPEGFVPETVYIEISPQEQKTKPIEMLYQWVNVLE